MSVSAEKTVASSLKLDQRGLDPLNFTDSHSQQPLMERDALKLLSDAFFIFDAEAFDYLGLPALQRH